MTFWGADTTNSQIRTGKQTHVSSKAKELEELQKKKKKEKETETEKETEKERKGEKRRKDWWECEDFNKEMLITGRKF